jgi:hypothetical protein
MQFRILWFETEGEQRLLDALVNLCWSHISSSHYVFSPSVMEIRQALHLAVHLQPVSSLAVEVESFRAPPMCTQMLAGPPIPSSARYLHLRGRQISLLRFSAACWDCMQHRALVATLGVRCSRGSIFQQEYCDVSWQA